ncbi:MAG: hypothetical protein K0S56_651 [Microvirga sp.]|nr:hypothetical protein [Microvirga sp.]
MAMHAPRLTQAQMRALVRILLVVAFAAPGLAFSSEPRILHIAPSPAGNSNGADWANAGGLEKLSAFVALAGPDGKVLLKADDGPYRISRQISIRAGGADGRPVTIAGADRAGNPAKAELVGSRADPWSLEGDPGSEVFRLSGGANYLRFEQIYFRNHGNGCFRIASDIQGLEIQDVDAKNVRRFLENHASGSGARASIYDITIRRVTVRGYSKGAIRLKDNSAKIVIEDVIGDSERQDGDNFAMGISLQDTVHDVVMRRVTMMNSHDSTHEYWNGDGFVTERGVHDVHIEDAFSSGSTDGGYDLKSSSTTLLRARAEDNMRNFRIWGDSRITDCVSRNPHKRGGNGKQNHFWVADGAKARVTGCKIEDQDEGTTAFEVGKKGEVIVENSLIRVNPRARLSLIHDGGLFHIHAAK